jgi:hypothetical protein
VSLLGVHLMGKPLIGVSSMTAKTQVLLPLKSRQ